ncbi:hypothetical protein GVM20_05145 [Porphyrobacter sp. SLTP]|jgi:hypothetical protein|nr:hypothetical protein [Porphyrobacter sp. SLTP]
MSVSRRTIVVGLGGAAVATGSVTTSIFSFLSVGDIRNKLNPTVRGRRNVALGRALFEDWSIQKGSFFTLDSGQVVELVDVKLFPNKEGRTSDLRPAAFVTTFEVRRGAPLAEERIYALAHSEGGEFPLLLNIDKGGAGKRISAVLG